jgi:tetratricopeptide (TPR) repeat protein
MYSFSRTHDLTAFKKAIASSDWSQAIQIGEQMDIASNSEEASLVANAYFERGSQLLEKSQYLSALQDFSKAHHFGITQSQFWFLTGRAYGNQKQYRQAVESFSKYLSQENPHSDVYLKRGLAFYGLAEYTLALKDFGIYATTFPELNINTVIKKTREKLIQQKSLRTQVSGIISDLQRSLDNKNLKLFLSTTQVICDLDERYTRLKVKHAQNCVDFGIILGNKKLFEHARNFFSLALKLEANFALAYFKRGLANHKLSQFNMADEDFIQALQLDPFLAPQIKLVRQSVLTKNVPKISSHGIKNILATNNYSSSRTSLNEYITKGFFIQNEEDEDDYSFLALDDVEEENRDEDGDGDENDYSFLSLNDIEQESRGTFYHYYFPDADTHGGFDENEDVEEYYFPGTENVYMFPNEEFFDEISASVVFSEFNDDKD